MNIPDLKLLYNIIAWHDSKRNEQGQHVGIFIPLPLQIAEQFPEEGKEGEDDSPPHMTLLYIGDLPEIFEENLKNVVHEVCNETKPFEVKLSSPKKFENDKNQTIVHSPVVSSKLKKLYNSMKNAVIKNGIPFSNKYPEFKPHITIEYINEGDEPKYNDIRPEGKWVVDSVWIWGTSEPSMIFLGK